MENKLEEEIETTKLLNSSHNEPPKSLFDTYKGLLYMFFSCLFKSLFSILIKYSLNRNESLTSYHLLFYKVNFMLIIFSIFTITIYKKDRKIFDNLTQINRNQLLFLIIRALLSILSCSLTAFSLKYMSISNVYSIYYLYPGIVVLFSHFILNEKVGNFDYICLFFCFIGVLCVLRPGINFFDDTNYGILSIFVLLSALFKACEDIILRYIGKKIHFLYTPLLYCIVGFFIYLIQVVLFKDNNELIIKMSLYD
jgi:drug/metabolite transporter (DMT)-like permease